MGELDMSNEKKLLNFKTSLIEVTKQINETYNMLCKLEVNNKKDSNEYKKEVLKLKELVGKEFSIYNDNDLSTLDYLITKESLKDFPLKRVINQLDKKINQKYIEEQAKEILDNIDEISLEVNGYETEKDKLRVIGLSLFQKESLSTILNEEKNLGTIYILNDLLTENTREDVRNYIIRTKYKISEENFLDMKYLTSNSFNYLTDEELSNFLFIDEEDLSDLKEDILKQQINQEILSILKVKDYNYNDPYSYLEVIKHKSYLEALLHLIDDISVLKAYNDTMKYTKSKSYKRDYKENNISLDIVRAILIDRKAAIDKFSTSNDIKKRTLS